MGACAWDLKLEKELAMYRGSFCSVSFSRYGRHLNLFEQDAPSRINFRQLESPNFDEAKEPLALPGRNPAIMGDLLLLWQFGVIPGTTLQRSVAAASGLFYRRASLPPVRHLALPRISGAGRRTSLLPLSRQTSNPPPTPRNRPACTLAELPERIVAIPHTPWRWRNTVPTTTSSAC